MMATPVSTTDPLVPAAVAGFVLLLVFPACSTNPSARVDSCEPAVGQVRFTPYDERPRILNHPEYREALTAAYPPALREGGIGGAAQIWVYIDECGSVADTRLVRSSGNAELDEVAKTVLETVPRFNPALLGDEPVPVWVQIPVTFTTEVRASDRAVHIVRMSGSTELLADAWRSGMAEVE